MHPFQIAINGRFIAPGDVSIVLGKAATTLLDAAKNVQSDAANVDVLAIVVTPYLAHLDVLILSPNAGNNLPTPVGGLVLREQDLQFPQYWSDPTSNAVAIHVAHADAASPCPIVIFSGTNTLDSSCLTKVGAVLRDAVLTEVANYARGPVQITGMNLNFGGVTTDCFGTGTGVLFPPSPQFPLAFPVTIGGLTAEIRPVPGGGLNATARLYLFSGPGPQIKLFEASETHDQPTWGGLAASRLAAIPVVGLGTPGVNPCSQRVK